MMLRNLLLKYIIIISGLKVKDSMIVNKKTDKEESSDTVKTDEKSTCLPTMHPPEDDEEEKRKKIEGKTLKNLIPSKLLNRLPILLAQIIGWNI